jgi:hypothetical protein
MLNISASLELGGLTLGASLRCLELFPFDIGRSAFDVFSVHFRSFGPFAFHHFASQWFTPSKIYFTFPTIGQPMSNPPCLNGGRFLMMKNRIENAVVKLGVIDGLLRPLFDPFDPSVHTRPSVFGARRSVFPNRLTHIAQPLAIQPPTSFRTRLNTNEHEIFTHPLMPRLGPFGPFLHLTFDPRRSAFDVPILYPPSSILSASYCAPGSLYRLFNHRTFQTNLKNEHNKTQKKHTSPLCNFTAQTAG